MVSESKWISLNSAEIAPPHAAGDAKWVAESPSPYDVPTHLRSFYNHDTGIFTIEFLYISQEPTAEVDLKPYFHILVGRENKRIYAIHFDIHNFNRDKGRIAKETRDSIVAFKGAKESNKDIALRAIDRHQRVFAAVVQA